MIDHHLNIKGAKSSLYREEVAKIEYGSSQSRDLALARCMIFIPRMKTGSTVYISIEAEFSSVSRVAGISALCRERDRAIDVAGRGHRSPLRSQAAFVIMFM